MPTKAKAAKPVKRMTKSDKFVFRISVRVDRPMNKTEARATFQAYLDMGVNEVDSAKITAVDIQ